jgi:hypothetical protein
MANNYATTREEAVDFGNKLMEYYIFAHVTRDHKFKDESLFYRIDPDWKSKVRSLRFHVLKIVDYANA